MSEKRRCEARIYVPAWGGVRQCIKTATTEHNGECYCATHYPPNAAKRKQATQVRFSKKQAAAAAERRERRLADAMLAYARKNLPKFVEEIEKTL
jgi:hypothetical protein